MRLPGYVKRGKYIQPENVPFREMLPLSLRDSVSGKSDKSVSASCVQEMSKLFACLKNNTFNEVPCSKEVSDFKKCWTETATRQYQKKMRDREGVLVPGETKLSHKQVTALLKNHPTR